MPRARNRRRSSGPRMRIADDGSEDGEDANSYPVLSYPALRSLMGNVGLNGTDVENTCASGNGKAFGLYMCGTYCSFYMQLEHGRFVQLVLLVFEGGEPLFTSVEMIVKWYWTRGSHGDVKCPSLVAAMAQIKGFAKHSPAPSTLQSFLRPLLDQVVDTLSIAGADTTLYAVKKTGRVVEMDKEGYLDFLNDFATDLMTKNNTRDFDPVVHACDGFYHVTERGLHDPKYPHIEDKDDSVLTAALAPGQDEVDGVQQWNITKHHIMTSKPVVEPASYVAMTQQWDLEEEEKNAGRGGSSSSSSEEEEEEADDAGAAALVKGGKGRVGGKRKKDADESSDEEEEEQEAAAAAGNTTPPAKTTRNSAKEADAAAQNLTPRARRELNKKLRDTTTTTTTTTADAPLPTRKRRTADDDDDATTTTATTTADATSPNQKRRTAPTTATTDATSHVSKRRTLAKSPPESKQPAAEVSAGTPTRAKAAAAAAAAVQTTLTRGKNTTSGKSPGVKSSRGVGKSATAAATTAPAPIKTAHGKTAASTKQHVRGGQCQAVPPSVWDRRRSLKDALFAQFHGQQQQKTCT
ncbi:hypothetical protein T484DRAFT_3631786 [Baffinella frigidus]|nr:hypothetical protein T484DRAFT_3631786 [Cryptophyta sp. CCMP2293]